MKRVWPIVMMISAWFASGCRSGSDHNASIFTQVDSLIEYKQPGAALSLRSCILSQNAQLLENLRLYSEAIPFYRAAINIPISIGDSTDMVLDIFCLTQIDSLDSAEAMLAEVYPLLPNLSPSDRAEVEISRRNLLRTRHRHL